MKDQEEEGDDDGGDERRDKERGHRREDRGRGDEHQVRGGLGRGQGLAHVVEPGGRGAEGGGERGWRGRSARQR